jgi:hypothetical protein
LLLSVRHLPAVQIEKPCVQLASPDDLWTASTTSGQSEIIICATMKVLSQQAAQAVHKRKEMRACILLGGRS